MEKSNCLTCTNTQSSRWYKNKTQCASCNKKEWYLKNREKALSKSRKWNDSNKEIKSDINKKWYVKNRNHRLNKNKDFKKLNPDYAFKWRKDNVEKRNTLSAKYRAQKLNATMCGFDNELLAIYSKAKNLEKEDNIKREVHHVIPLQQYDNIVCGLHVPWNLQILTKQEHLKAHEGLRKTMEKYGDKTKTNSN